MGSPVLLSSAMVESVRTAVMPDRIEEVEVVVDIVLTEPHSPNPTLSEVASLFNQNPTQLRTTMRVQGT